MGCCTAIGCKNNSRTVNRAKKPCKLEKPKVSFYRFPRDPKRRAAWIHALRRVNFNPNTHARVCSDHFEEYDYKTSPLTGNKSLKEDAVPSVFPAFPSYYQKKTKPRKPPKVRVSLPVQRALENISKERQYKQDPTNLFVAHRNSLLSTCASLVSMTPKFQLPLSPEPSSESDQNLEKPDPDFDPSDYIFPVDMETYAEENSETESTVKISPEKKSSPLVNPLEISTPSPSPPENDPSEISTPLPSPPVKGSSEISTPLCNNNNNSKKPSVVVKPPVLNFLATNAHEIGRSDPCSNCKLYSKANILLANELEGREQTICFLQSELNRLKNKLAVYESKKINVRIINKKDNGTVNHKKDDKKDADKS